MTTLRLCVEVGDDGEMNYDVGARTTHESQLLRAHQSSCNSVASNFHAHPLINIVPDPLIYIVPVKPAQVVSILHVRPFDYRNPLNVEC